MRDYKNKYKWLSIITIVIVSILLFLQYRWYKEGIKLKAEYQNSELLRIMPDIAININSIDHDQFHINLASLDSSILPQLLSSVERTLSQNQLSHKVHVALYQDSIDGIFISDRMDLKSEFLNSKLKHCLSCIQSMSFVKKDLGIDLDSLDQLDLTDQELTLKLNQNTQFTYYTPVSGLMLRGTDPNEILWVSIYYPEPSALGFNKLTSILGICILLICLILALYFKVLKALSNQRKLNKVKEDIFNNMTHEFKTPLSSIMLATKVLTQNKNPNKTQEYLNLITKESQSLETQIDKLLELSQLDQGHSEIGKEQIDVHSILLTLKETFKMKILDKNAQLQFNLDAINYNIIGDNNYLKSAFQNIVENSLIYSQDKVQIKISTKNKNGKLEIKLRDDGIGIKQEFRPHIFERFFRAQEGNSYKGKGFGIGLSYVKEIVESHDGQITLNENYDDGTEFIILLNNE